MKEYNKNKSRKYSAEDIEPTQPKPFASYPYVIAIMAVLQVLCTMYGRKFFLFLGLMHHWGDCFYCPRYYIYFK